MVGAGVNLVSVHFGPSPGVRTSHHPRSSIFHSEHSCCEGGRPFPNMDLGMPLQFLLTQCSAKLDSGQCKSVRVRKLTDSVTGLCSVNCTRSQVKVICIWNHHYLILIWNKWMCECKTHCGLLFNHRVEFYQIENIYQGYMGLPPGGGGGGAWSQEVWSRPPLIRDLPLEADPL